MHEAGPGGTGPASAWWVGRGDQGPVLEVGSAPWLEAVRGPVSGQVRAGAGVVAAAGRVVVPGAVARGGAPAEPATPSAGAPGSVCPIGALSKVSFMDPLSVRLQSHPCIEPPGDGGRVAESCRRP